MVDSIQEQFVSCFDDIDDLVKAVHKHGHDPKNQGARYLACDKVVKLLSEGWTLVHHVKLGEATGLVGLDITPDNKVGKLKVIAKLDPAYNLPEIPEAVKRDFRELCEKLREGKPEGKPGAHGHRPNDWLYEQHKKRGRPLPELRDEWMERRNKEKLEPPIDIDDSMKKAIRQRERKGKN